MLEPRRGETEKALVLEVVTVAAEGGMVGSFLSLSMSLFMAGYFISSFACKVLRLKGTAHE